MLISTTDSITGYKIVKHRDIVSERVVVGVGMFSELFGAFTDTFGGRSRKFEDRIGELHEYALKGLKMKTKILGANAVIGLKFDVDQISTKNGSLW